MGAARRIIIWDLILRAGSDPVSREKKSQQPRRTFWGIVQHHFHRFQVLSETETDSQQKRETVRAQGKTYRSQSSSPSVAQSRISAVQTRTGIRRRPQSRQRGPESQRVRFLDGWNRCARTLWLSVLVMAERRRQMNLSHLLIPLFFALACLADSNHPDAVREFFGHDGEGPAGGGSKHTNNWAVLVCASRYWFNYRV
jgi:hypothetical protein